MHNKIESNWNYIVLGIAPLIRFENSLTLPIIALFDNLLLVELAFPDHSFMCLGTHYKANGWLEQLIHSEIFWTKGIEIVYKAVFHG